MIVYSFFSIDKILSKHCIEFHGTLRCIWLRKRMGWTPTQAEMNTARRSIQRLNCYFGLGTHQSKVNKRMNTISRLLSLNNLTVICCYMYIKEYSLDVAFLWCWERLCGPFFTQLKFIYDQVHRKEHKGEHMKGSLLLWDPNKEFSTIDIRWLLWLQLIYINHYISINSRTWYCDIKKSKDILYGQWNMNHTLWKDILVLYVLLREQCSRKRSFHHLSAIAYSIL